MIVTPSTEITAFIAGVTAASEISLNKGSNDGLAVADTVEYSRKVKIFDPVTREELGQVKYQICNFKINFVAEKFSIAQVVDWYSDNNNFFTLVQPFTQSTKLKTVTTQEEKVKNGVVLIKVGDPVTVEKPVPIPVPKRPKSIK